VEIGKTRNVPDLSYFLVDIFNTRAGVLSSFLEFFSKFAQLLYIKFNIFNFIHVSLFGEGGTYYFWWGLSGRDFFGNGAIAFLATPFRRHKFLMCSVIAAANLRE
jgi:hypothetical protein